MSICPKCRGGVTGEAGKWFYDYKSRKVYDLEDYLKEQGTVIPEESTGGFETYDDNATNVEEMFK